MKIVSTLAAVLLISFGAIAQNNTIQTQFSELANRENVTHISIGSKMFEMMMSVEAQTPEEQEMLEAFSKVEGVEAYGSENDVNRGFHKTACARLDDRFEELITIENDEVTATIFIDETNGVVRELVAIGETDKGWGIGSIWGNVDLKYVSKIMREIQMDGLDKVDHTQFDMSAKINVYPNPASQNSFVTFEVPKELVKGTYGVFDGQGKLLLSGQITAQTGRIDLENLPRANYVIKFENQAGEGFVKQILVQ